MDDLPLDALRVDERFETVGVSDAGESLREFGVFFGDFVFKVALERGEVVLSRVDGAHRVDGLVERGLLVDGVGAVFGVRLRGVDEGLHQRAEIDVVRFEGQRVRRESVLLHGIDVVGRSLRHRHDERDADDADRAGEGGEDGPSLLCEEVF